MLKILTGRLIFVRLIMLTAMAALIAIGIIAIYASGNPQHESDPTEPSPFATSWKKQAVFAVIGLAGLIGV
ncbi:MAG: hypothetical protein ACYS6I_01795, partial [Planctomycetota bacterium]